MGFPNAILSAAASFTRPANTTAYASGQLVANSTTAGSVAALNLSGVAAMPGRAFQVRRVTLSKSGTGVTNAAFRVHFYSSSSVTAANGDGAAWSTNKAANYLGSVDVTVDKAFTDGAVGSTACDFSSNAAWLCAVIEARGAYTPGNAEVFTIKVDIGQ